MSKTLSDLETVEGIRKTVRSLLADADINNVRYLLVLSGQQDWCCQTAETVLAEADYQKILWIGAAGHIDEWQLESRQVLGMLGRETDAVVFNAFNGFDVDAFAAISGTIRGGGVLILLTPPLEEWPTFPDPENLRITVAPYTAQEVSGRFLHRFAQCIRDAADVVHFEQRAGKGVFPHRKFKVPKIVPVQTQAPADTDCLTVDQQLAVEAILKVSRGHRRRPVVLSADRGRGKSAALGIAAAKLLRAGLQRIVVTGPQLETVEGIFTQAQRVLPECKTTRTRLQFRDAEMSFLPPDDLLANPIETDLLLVDEAATIPVPMLVNLLRRYSRIAFATTVHGYEGTGRGFSLRFAAQLDAYTRGWRIIELTKPIRWASDDPLERFTFQSLLLNATAAADSEVQAVLTNECQIEWLNRNHLVEDEHTLQGLFGLLILAHYRTRPYDLRHILDGPNLKIAVSRFDRHVVGTVVVAREGGFDTQTANLIWAGVTRPHGHLIPESLAVHVGLPFAPELRCLRIMRIGVHPGVQGRGIGSQVVVEVHAQAVREGVDYVGVSFGATGSLLRFWLRHGYVPVRVSVKRGASSGAHSVLMCRPVTVSGQDMIDVGRERFQALFLQQLSDILQDFEVELVLILLPYCVAPSMKLSADDWRDVISFAYGQRIYEVCVGAIWRLVSDALLDTRCQEMLFETESTCLVAKVLQKHDWKTVARLAGLTGRAESIAVLRQGLRKMTRLFGDVGVCEQADKLQKLIEEK